MLKNIQILIIISVIVLSCEMDKSNDTVLLLNKHIESTGKEDLLFYNQPIYYLSNNKNLRQIMLNSSEFNIDCVNTVANSFILEQNTGRTIYLSDYIDENESNISLIGQSELLLKNEININNREILEQNDIDEYVVMIKTIEMWENENNKKIHILPFPIFSKDSLNAIIIYQWGNQMKYDYYVKLNNQWKLECKWGFQSDYMLH